MRSLILRQCRDVRMGLMWENLGALTTVRARQFWVYPKHPFTSWRSVGQHQWGGRYVTLFWCYWLVSYDFIFISHAQFVPYMLKVPLNNNHLMLSLVLYVFTCRLLLLCCKVCTVELFCFIHTRTDCTSTWQQMKWILIERVELVLAINVYWQYRQK